MSRRIVVDTCVLRKANAPLKKDPKEGRLFGHRVKILRQITDGAATVLFSEKLLREYREQLLEPRNAYVAAFFALLTSGGAVRNYPPFTGAEREDVARCKYPPEDVHVLRTAKGEASTIVTEEHRLLAVDRCIHRCFRVHIADPEAAAAAG